MDCNRAQKLISLYLAGDLSGEDLVALMEHLGACPKCRGAFEEAKRFEAALKGVFKETISKSRSPKSRVLRRIKDEGTRRRPGKSLVNWFIFFLLMAALSFLIIVAYISYEKLKQENIEKSLAAKRQLAPIIQALREYRADHGTYPSGSNADMVKALQSIGAGDRPYRKFQPSELSEGLLIDPWRKPYVYRSTGETSLIYSTGPNRVDDSGLGDDIRP